VPVCQASPSTLLGSSWPLSKDEHKGLALALSTLTMRTNFCPPGDCQRKKGEKGQRGMVEGLKVGLAPPTLLCTQPYQQIQCGL
jgi:hypothetical protein